MVYFFDFQPSLKSWLEQVSDWWLLLVGNNYNCLKPVQVQGTSNFLLIWCVMIKNGYQLAYMIFCALIILARAELKQRNYLNIVPLLPKSQNLISCYKALLYFLFIFRLKIKENFEQHVSGKWGMSNEISLLSDQCLYIYLIRVAPSFSNY